MHTAQPVREVNLYKLHILWFNSDILEKQNYGDSKKISGFQELGVVTYE